MPKIELSLRCKSVPGVCYYTLSTGRACLKGAYCMILFGNLLMGLGQILGMMLNLVLMLVLVSVILSWLRLDPYHPLVNYIHTVAESLYRIPRKYINTAVGYMDFAPLIIVLAAYFLQTVLVNSLMEYGYQLKQSAILGSRGGHIQELLPEAGKGKRL